jgi:hypothetical protein
MTLPAFRFLCTLVSTAGVLVLLPDIRPSVVHARAAQGASNIGDWIYLGTVADTAGNPSKWLGDTGFVFADAARKSAVAPAVGDRLQLTTVKQIRRIRARFSKCSR